MPGQKRIMATMSEAEKLYTVEANEKLRKNAVRQAEQELGDGTEIKLMGTFLNLGIRENGEYDARNDQHREIIKNIGAPRKPLPPPEPPISILEPVNIREPIEVNIYVGDSVDITLCICKNQRIN